MTDYLIDLKVFNSVPEEEIGVMMPLNMVVNGKVRPGVYQIVLNTTEALLDQLQEKTFEHPDLKILGVHRLKI